MQQVASEEKEWKSTVVSSSDRPIGHVAYVHGAGCYLRQLCAPCFSYLPVW